MNPAEPVLRSLLMRGLEGDGAAYHAFLRQLCAHLRAYLGRRLFGWPDDVDPWIAGFVRRFARYALGEDK